MGTRVKQGSETTQYFCDIAAAFLEREGVTEGSLMGFPCLHVNGDFFSTCDYCNGDLIVKLPRTRVTNLIEAGHGDVLAPAGRTFKEWVLIKRRDKKTWVALMNESREFVAQKKA